VIRRRALLAAALAIAAVSSASADSERIVFAAWNVRNYLQQPALSPEGRVVIPAKSPASVEAVISTLAAIRPDILGLCEVGTRRDLADLQRQLKKSGVDLPHTTWVGGDDAHRHLALLSRFPLGPTRHDTKSRFLLGGVPVKPRRGFLDTTVRIHHGFSLRVLGAHLKSRRIVPAYDQAEFRRLESLLLRDRLTSILQKDPQTNLLLFGDFNDTKNSPVVRGLQGRRGSPEALNSLTLRDRVGDHWTYQWAETDEYSRIDYVMVSNTLRPFVNRDASRIQRRSDWRTASDHRPLVVVLDIPKGADRQK